MVNAPTLTANADDARVFSAHGAWNVANGEVLERLREQPKAADAAVKTRRGLAASPALSIVERGLGASRAASLGFSLRRVDAVVPWICSGSAQAVQPISSCQGRLVAFSLVASRRAAESTYAGIVRLVEAAQRSKAPMARLADRFAIGFLVATVTIALGAWFLTRDPIRLVAVLVVATPCRLILAVPVAIVSGLSRAAKQGILVKGGKALETMARIRALVVDKTGTLTAGGAKVVAVHAAPGFTADEVIWIAASLDQASKHIVAQTIVSEARSCGLDLSLPTDVDETAGEGICGQVIGRSVAVGGVRFVSTVAQDEAGETQACSH